MGTYGNIWENMGLNGSQKAAFWWLSWLFHNSYFTVVYRTYDYCIHGVYKPTTKLGGSTMYSQIQMGLSENGVYMDVPFNNHGAVSNDHPIFRQIHSKLLGDWGCLFKIWTVQCTTEVNLQINETSKTSKLELVDNPFLIWFTTAPKKLRMGGGLLLCFPHWVGDIGDLLSLIPAMPMEVKLHLLAKLVAPTWSRETVCGQALKSCQRFANVWVCFARQLQSFWVDTHPNITALQTRARCQILSY